MTLIKRETPVIVILVNKGTMQRFTLLDLNSFRIL